tara:strand:- start:1632 stop:2756 length:1125 start_codon:yes stop_codon:yes gene_type:complete
MSKKFKIVLIANTFNFFNAFMLEHIRQLSKNNEVFICCNEAYKLKRIVPKKVILVNINFKRGISLLNDFFAFVSVLFFFFKKKPNISISFTPKVGFIVSLCSFISMTPYRIHWFTGQIWVKRGGVIRIFYRLIDKLISFLSNDIFIDSISQKNFLIKEKIISKDKSIVFHKGSVGGVDVKKFKFNQIKRNKIRKQLQISKKTFVFLYLGRINSDKGIEDLVTAFDSVKINHDIFLIFVGSIEETKFRKILNNKKKILYFKPTNKPEEWFSMADILCLPSHREGFGTVVIEAAACGIPAICSKIYGLTDAVIKNKTGFFHKVSNINDIKNKMTYVIKNTDLVKKYGIQAKKRVFKDFKKNLLTERLLKFVNSKKY